MRSGTRGVFFSKKTHVAQSTVVQNAKTQFRVLPGFRFSFLEDYKKVANTAVWPVHMKSQRKGRDAYYKLETMPTRPLP